MIPLEIHSPENALFSEILWEDRRFIYPHWALRGFCPCAHCQGHQGPIMFRTQQIPAPNSSLDSPSLDSVLIQTLSPVGNYALNIHWKDGHSTGIYHFHMLRELGEHIQQSQSGVFGEAEAKTIAFSRS